MCVVFTDLDGTLLDHESYSLGPALETLAELRRRAIPVVFTTSKTRAETEMWRSLAGNNDPFIVENGGAIVDHPHVTVLGAPYAVLTSALREASRVSGCRVRGFADATPAEIAEMTSLPLDQVRLSMLREYDEPFLILDSDREAALLEAIERAGFRHTRGGRFHHILGANDKAAAVRLLIARYGQPHTIGLGDGLNDLDFLRLVDRPIVMPSAHSGQILAALPHATLAPEPGPRGWARAVLDAI